MYLRSLKPAAMRHDSRPVAPSWLTTEGHPAPAWREAAPAGDVAEQRRVLQVLIEELGGEATAASLRARLLLRDPGARTEPLSGTWLRSVLGDLDVSGAMTLEDMDGDDVIVRITRAGAGMAYEPTA